MTVLSLATRRRLQQLPQVPSVWEGDRRPLHTGGRGSVTELRPTRSEGPESGSESSEGDCILWVDGSQGFVRAMDVVSLDMGPEAVVRTLLRAMEHPHNPGMPCRPQKIVVSNRELLFFLRGVLQDLDIALDYVPDLPLIDEIFRSFQDVAGAQPPQLPPPYDVTLMEQAFEIWDVSLWEKLADHQILAVEVNQWDVETLYVSVMGMLGMEYGLLLYRSLDSLKRFRERVLANESMEHMEAAFLGQDCLFVTFEGTMDDWVGELDLATLPPDDIEPVFGNLHPLEGVRSFLYEEEAAAMYVALEALKRFFRQNSRKFSNSAFPSLNGRYKIIVPETDSSDELVISVKVSTLPDVATELMAMADSAAPPSLPPGMPVIRDDLVPPNSFLSLGVVPWEMLEFLRSGAEYYQPQEITTAGDGLPVIMIQTSRPKAKALIEEIRTAGGLQSICFNPGEDPTAGDRYDLGLFKTGNGELQLFGEFGEADPTHADARKKWDQRCKKTKGYCGLIVAKGLTGASRGNPQFKDMMALFEAQAVSSKDLGLGTLQLTVAVDWM